MVCFLWHFYGEHWFVNFWVDLYFKKNRNIVLTSKWTVQITKVYSRLGMMSSYPVILHSSKWILSRYFIFKNKLCDYNHNIYFNYKYTVSVGQCQTVRCPVFFCLFYSLISLFILDKKSDNATQSTIMCIINNYEYFNWTYGEKMGNSDDNEWFMTQIKWNSNFNFKKGQEW